MPPEVSHEIAGDLRAAWIEFIAFSAAHRMYSDLPKQLKSEKRKAYGTNYRRQFHGRTSQRRTWKNIGKIFVTETAPIGDGKKPLNNNLA